MTVSVPVLLTAAVVLIGGLAVMLVANAVLLRVGLAPLERVTRRMATVADISFGDGRESLVRTAIDITGRLDVLVNNAGVTATAPVRGRRETAHHAAAGRPPSAR